MLSPSKGRICALKLSVAMRHALLTKEGEGGGYDAIYLGLGLISNLPHPALPLERGGFIKRNPAVLKYPPSMARILSIIRRGIPQTLSY